MKPILNGLFLLLVIQYFGKFEMGNLQRYSKRQGGSHMKTIRYFYQVLLSPLFMVLFFLSDASASQKSVMFHSEIGVSVDSLTNARLNLFGNVRGFSAARLYLTDNGQYKLHSIRNAENGAHVAIFEISQIDWLEMLRKIEGRYKTAQSGGQPPPTPVFVIGESFWTENHSEKKIVLCDGNEIMGTLVRARRDTLIFKTLGGLHFEIPDSSIEKVAALRGTIGQGRWAKTDPNQSRLFFAPTARKLKPGSGYFADYYVFFPTLAVGVLDFLSISGGMSLIPGAETQVFLLAPKLTFDLTPKAGISAGFMTLKVPDEKAFTLGYSVVTFGGASRGITLGAGIPFNRDTNGNMILLVGAESQVSNSVKLITENWIFTGADGLGLFSAGIRFFGERLSVDLALITTQEAFKGDGFPFIPYVDFAVFFGD